jgi:cell wall-associated NlpC family hydrolase
VTDPLADPRAEDLLAAVPADVTALAAAFHTAATEAGMTAAGLRAARNDGTWTGHAADSFRQSIGHVPAELERVRTGYSAVAVALRDYEDTLALIQSEFVKVVGELGDVRTQIGTTQTAATIAKNGMTPGHPLSYNDLLQAELAIARAQHTLEGYHAEARRLHARALTLLDEFATARTLCRATVAAAGQTAPARPLAGQGKHVAGLDGRLSRAGGAVWQMTPLAGGDGGSPSAEERRRIAAMIRAADRLLGTPYVSGGGHSGGGPQGGGLDCSGFVSAVLRSGGYLNGPVTTEGFAAQPGISTGPGRYVTIYDRTGCGANEHVIIAIHGRFYESGGGSGSGGAPFVHQFHPDAGYLASFNTVLHPTGL